MGTPSDLSKRLEKSDATIVEHLNILCKVGLVKKIEQPGKKWVFYTLTERGKGIISSKSRRLVIILATSVLAFFGGLASFVQYNSQSAFYTGMKTTAEIGKGASEVNITSPLLLYLSISLFTISFVGFVFYIIKKQNIKGRLV